ncbi:hypothetical protein Dvina_29855 [Dactylosporangium vinaceum]|uniref:Uncharacterized protein n=1 Tax=Dactylosporangium vinaceum TaxID=53362 RepID=A0ABV5LZ73_9ACTN|nr:hypothetical protein [Dactylosporangium vinaceum]UAB92546.1 hypothetical protein Dvina_29855 [Dactylosporangium vinaceum]
MVIEMLDGSTAGHLDGWAPRRLGTSTTGRHGDWAGRGLGGWAARRLSGSVFRRHGDWAAR